MFCVLFSMLSNKTINQSEDSAAMLELCKMMNYKLNRASDYLIPSKELFIEVKQHCLQTLLCLVKEEGTQGNNTNPIILSPRNNNFKAFVMPHNNGKLVASILKRRAWWKILKHQTDYDFIWTPLLRRDLIDQLPLPNIKGELCEIAEDVESCNPLIYNKIEDNYNLSNKKNLFLNMKEYYKSIGEDMHNSIPLTFLVSSDVTDSNFAEFKDCFNRNIQLSKNNQWILKPGEFTNRGNGIKICQKLAAIEKYVQSNKHECYIIQKYIHNPLLLMNEKYGSKRKFDIRCFALFTSFNNTERGYFFQDGYLRTASKEFSETNINNKFIHLTNDAIQKKCDEYGKYESSNKLSFTDFQKYLEKMYPSKFESGIACFYSNIYPKIKKLVSDSFLATKGKMNPNHRSNCFELYGYDFMITDDFNVLLIEVNTNPCLETPCSLLSSIISSVLDNTFRIVLDPFTFQQNSKTQELCDSSNNLCKFELIYENKIAV